MRLFYPVAQVLSITCGRLQEARFKHISAGVIVNDLQPLGMQDQCESPRCITAARGTPLEGKTASPRA